MDKIEQIKERLREIGPFVTYREVDVSKHPSAEKRTEVAQTFEPYSLLSVRGGKLHLFYIGDREDGPRAGLAGICMGENDLSVDNLTPELMADGKARYEKVRIRHA